MLGACVSVCIGRFNRKMESRTAGLEPGRCLEGKIYGYVVASSCERGGHKRLNDNNEIGDATLVVKVDLRYEVLVKGRDSLGQNSRGARATVMKVI